MTETVILPPEGRRTKGMFIPPLLVIPFLLFNIIAFTFYGSVGANGWNSEVWAITMVTGTKWALTSGDLMLVLGLVCLFFEVLKSTNTGRSSVLEHMISTILFVVFLVEFLLVPNAASSVFFLLMMMSVVDVIAGFTISITGAGRDVTMG